MTELIEAKLSSFTACISSFIVLNKSILCNRLWESERNCAFNSRKNGHYLFKQIFSQNSAFLKFQKLWDTVGVDVNHIVNASISAILVVSMVTI